MKICVCCSASFPDEVLSLAKEIEALGHEVLLPNCIVQRQIERADFDPIKTKAATNAVRKHFDKIRESDAILVCNYTKKGIENYIGANTFLEMGFAHYYKKPIYVLNPLPEQEYINDEIKSFETICLSGDPEQLTRA